MREQDKLHIRENVQAMYIFELLMGWLDRSILTPEQDDKIENVAKRLQAVGFIVGDTIYRPHIGRDVVLGLSVDGVAIHPGDQFPKATVIDLIAGEGDQPLIAEDTLSIEDF